MRLTWDVVSDKNYIFGVDQVVYYTDNGVAEAWSGVVSVETSLEASGDTRYFDGRLYTGRKVTDAFSARITALSNPASMDMGILGQVRPKPFGLSYKTDTEKGAQIHLVYNSRVRSTDYMHKTGYNEPMHWDIETRPVDIPEHGPASHIYINTWEAHPEAVMLLEEILYGTEDLEARMPSPTEIFEIFVEYAILVVTDNGDGTWTATGPDSAIKMIDLVTFRITWPSAVYVDTDTYVIYSY